MAKEIKKKSFNLISIYFIYLYSIADVYWIYRDHFTILSANVLKLGPNPGENNMCDAIGADCFDKVLKNATSVSLCKDCPEDCDTVKNENTIGRHGLR